MSQKVARQLGGSSSWSAFAEVLDASEIWKSSRSSIVFLLDIFLAALGCVASSSQLHHVQNAWNTQTPFVSGADNHFFYVLFAPISMWSSQRISREFQRSIPHTDSQMVLSMGGHAQSNGPPRPSDEGAMQRFHPHAGDALYPWSLSYAPILLTIYTCQNIG
jgi:hypothetical protein